MFFLSSTLSSQTSGHGRSLRPRSLADPRERSPLFYLFFSRPGRVGTCDVPTRLLCCLVSLLYRERQPFFPFFPALRCGARPPCARHKPVHRKRVKPSSARERDCCEADDYRKYPWPSVAVTGWRRGLWPVA